jgi:ribosomal protein S27AE
MKRLMPGVYDDEQGGLHLDLAELLAANGYADTKGNRQTVIDAVRHSFGGNVIITDGPIRLSYTCPRCGRVSFNPHDREQRYCGACHQFETN